MHQRLYRRIIVVIRMTVQMLAIRRIHYRMLDSHHCTGSAAVARASLTLLNQIVVVAAKKEGI